MTRFRPPGSRPRKRRTPEGADPDVWGATVSSLTPEGYGDALRRYARGVKRARGWKAVAAWAFWVVLVALSLGGLVIFVWSAFAGD